MKNAVISHPSFSLLSFPLLSFPSFLFLSLCLRASVANPLVIFLYRAPDSRQPRKPQTSAMHLVTNIQSD
jgi:hypothetical protein